MIKGNTIIYNDSYIDELNRHLDSFKHQYEIEELEDLKEKLQQKIEFFTKKIDESIEFQDSIDTIENLDIPSLAVVKTVTGKVIPLANVKVL